MIDYTKPWSRIQSEPRAVAESPFVLDWTQETTGGAQIRHTIRFRQGTESEPDYSGALKVRLLCHFLLNRIPDTGLAEVADSLGSILEYYSMVRERPTGPKTLAEESIRARLGECFERPDFHLADE